MPLTTEDGMRLLTDEQRHHFDETLDALRARRKAGEDVSASIRKVKDQRKAVKRAEKRRRKAEDEQWHDKALDWIGKAVDVDALDAYVDAEVDDLRGDVAGLIATGASVDEIKAWAAGAATRIGADIGEEFDAWFEPEKLPWPKSVAWVGTVLEAVDGIAARWVAQRIVPGIEVKILAMLD